MLFLTAFVAACQPLAGAAVSSTRDAIARTSTTSSSLPDGCTNPAVATNGHRRLALIVGVGKYLSDEVRTLAGPPHDAETLRTLLERAYDFPKENVCVLKDEQATLAAFKAAFEQSLVRRAQKDDIAVVYFSGHGSQQPDGPEGDEEDQLDETWLFHDSRQNGVPDLVDDEVGKMMAGLVAKGPRVTLILDSCNSETGLRGSEGGFVERWTPMVGAARDGRSAAGQPLPDRGPVLTSLDGVAQLTAASDGTSAVERDGKGIFTDALVEVLARAPKDPLLYSQVDRQVALGVAARRSHQKPYFHGPRSREVFGIADRTRPLSWDVTKAEGDLQLQGPPLAGMGVGAELRVYSPKLAAGEYEDPAKAKAFVAVKSYDGLNATAVITARASSAPAIAAGDVAILVHPSEQSLRLRVGVRPDPSNAATSAAIAKKLAEAIAASSEARVSVELVKPAEDPEFEIRVVGEKLQLLGPERTVRNEVPDGDVAKMTEHLWMHARQKALATLRGEGGTAFSDDRSLRVWLTPTQEQSPCGRSRASQWVDAKDGEEQVIPLCVNVLIHVKNESPMKLLVGGVALSSEGSIWGFPGNGGPFTIEAGKEAIFSDTLVGGRPLGTRDTLRVFGTQEGNYVPWDLLTAAAAERGAVAYNRGPSKKPGGLYAALDRYMSHDQRGLPYPPGVAQERSAWTATSIAMRVEANKDLGAPATTREYTLNDFDIRPYYPDDEKTHLYRLLKAADDLTRQTPRIPYHQGWDDSLPEEKNLEQGIDCSRAIWLAYKRAGLPYTRDGAYVNTAKMLDPGTSPLALGFSRCDAESALMPGDLIVYRDADPKRDKGHVVMVIDPAKRIAWGSHGYDGNVREGKLPERGVQYQLIKYKTDWQAWDRSDMQKVACWRSKTLAEEALAGGVAGMRALGEDPCNMSFCARP